MKAKAIGAMVAVLLAGGMAGTANAATFDLVGTHPDAAAQPTAWGKTLTALTAFNGKIYAGYGDWNANTGPINLRPFDPGTDTFGASLLSAPTEAIFRFREIDGKLYAPDIDPLGSAPGGYAVGTAAGANETWVHTAPVSATHIFDMASFGGDLWMCGSLGDNATVWRDSPETGWDLSLSVYGGGGTRCWGLGVFDGKLYTVISTESQVKSRVFDGTSWSDGPDLLPNGGRGMIRAREFADKLVYLGQSSSLTTFDGTTVSDLLTAITDYKIDGNLMYTLSTDDRTVKYTTDLVHWETVGVAPEGATSLAILEDNLYVGAGDGKLYRYSEPIPSSLLVWDGLGDGDWGERDLGTGNSNWLYGGLPGPRFPDDRYTHAVVRIDKVTVAADRTARKLTVDSGEVEIAAGRTLTITENVSFAPSTVLTLGNDAALTVGFGGGLNSVETEGNATISNGDNLVVACYSDGGVAGSTFTKQGAGTLSLDNSSAGSVDAGQTVFRIEGGTLKARGDNPLGGSKSIILAGGTLSIEGGAGTPADGPAGALAHWKFDESFGTIAYNSAPDTVGYYNGTVSGATWTDSGDSQRDRVLKFDGSHDWVDIPSMGPAVDAFSVAMWINPAARSGDNTVLLNNDYWNSGSLHFSINNNGRIKFDVNGGTGAKWSEFVFPLDEWHHVVATYQANGNMVYYVDGVEDATFSGLNNRSILMDGRGIGAWFHPSADRFFNGMLDDVFIYDRALTAEEAIELYGGGWGPHIDEDTNMTDTTVTVTADSTLNVATQREAGFGALIMGGGTLTTAGAQGISFRSTTVSAVSVGFHTMVDTRPGRIEANAATITKSGPADLVLEGDNDGLNGATLDVQEGRLVGVHASNPFGTAKLQLNGGEVLLSAKATGLPLVAFGNEVVVEADSTLTAGAAGGGAPGPQTILLSTPSGVVLNNGTLTLRTTHGYGLYTVKPVTGPGGLRVTEGDVILGEGGDVGSVAVTGGALNIGDDLSVSRMEVTGGRMNTHAYRVVVSESLKLSETTFEISAGNTFTAEGSNLSAKADLTLSGGTVTVSPATHGLGLNAKFYDAVYGSYYLDPIANLQSQSASGTATLAGQLNYAQESELLSLSPALTDGDRFSILWEGVFAADQPGTYTFGTRSDDGSVLYLDLNSDGDFADGGELIVDNNGNHPAMNITGEVNLDAGEYLIAIGHYEDGVDAAMAAKFRQGSGLGYEQLDYIDGSSGPFFTGSTTAAIDLTNTNLTVAENSTIDVPREVRFGNLTIEGNRSLTVRNAACQFSEVTAGDGASIIGDILVRDTLSPGNSAGTLSVVGDLSLGTDATYALEVGSSRCDLVEVSGQLSLADGWTLQLLDAGVSWSHGDLLLFTCAGQINLGQVTLDLSEVSGPGFEDWRFDDPHVYQDGANVLLGGVTVIPEPATLALLALGALAMIRRRR